MRSWYEIRNAADAAVVRLFDDIGTGGITAAGFLAEVDGLRGPLEVHVNSRGGAVGEALAIYNGLRARGNVTVIVDGIAASAASIIAMAASPGRLLIHPSAQMMVHSAWTAWQGNAAAARETASVLDRQDENLAGIYAARTGRPASYWLGVMRAETWYTGQEAVDAGLADAVAGQPAFPVAAQARKYVTSAPALPGNMTELAEFLADPGNAARGFDDAYQHARSRFGAIDGGEVAAQLAAQRPDISVTARQAARYSPHAPGAKAYNRSFSSLGEFLGLITMPRGRGLDALRINDSFSSEDPGGGGFLVPEEVRSEVLQWTLESAIARPRAVVVPVSAARSHIPVLDDTSHSSSVLGGVNFFWTEEGTQIPETAATFGRATMDAKKLAGFSTLPAELAADAPALAAYFRATLPEAIAWAEDEGFIAETGAGTPQGIISASCAISVTRGTGGKVLLADIANMVARMLPQSLQRGCWLAGTDVFPQLLETWLQVGTAPASAASAPAPWLGFDSQHGTFTLLGRPLYPTEHASALGTRGDLMFCDFGMYLIGDRQELRIEPSEHYAFPTDKIVYKITERLDGRMWVSAPVTPKRGANTLSPLVVLQ